MANQINLLNPLYRRTRHPLNAFNMTLAAGAMFALCGVWNATERMSGARLDARKADVDQRLKQAKSSLEGLTANTKKAEPKKELIDEIAKLEFRLRVQREILTALETGGLGSSDGFSRFLSALARQRLEGVWLTKISVSADNQLAIGGRMIRADLLPTYIRLLNKEESLRGRRFGELKLVAQKHSTEAAAEPVERPGAARKAVAIDASVIEFELGAAQRGN